jgi:16S rRNA (uracil1498-N3)-methyltransferase
MLLTTVEEAVTLKEFLKKTSAGLKLIAHCEETDKKTLKSVVQKSKH